MKEWFRELYSICGFRIWIVASWLVFVGLSSWLLSGCHDGCAKDSTRCNEDRVEICNTETDWELEADCGEIEDFGLGLEWTCCVDPEDGLHSCLPVEDCTTDPDAGDGGI